MSGLAKYLLEEGNIVSGSDIQDSKYIDALRELGAKVYIGHCEDNVPKDATVIVSTAIRANNPELVEAKKLGLKVYHRSDLLEEIAKSAQDNGKIFIGFSGTHGKTTTSGLASFVLENAGLKPSFVVGGIVPEIHTNAQHRMGRYFVAELDESDGTIVVTTQEESESSFAERAVTAVKENPEGVAAPTSILAVGLLAGYMFNVRKKSPSYIGTDSDEENSED